MSMDLHPTPFPGKFQPVKSRFNKNISKKTSNLQSKEPSISRQNRVFGTVRSTNVPTKPVSGKVPMAKSSSGVAQKPLRSPKQTQSLTDSAPKTTTENATKPKPRKKSVCFQENRAAAADAEPKTPSKSPVLAKPRLSGSASTPFQSAEKCSKCRFDRLETSSYWLSQIKLAETVGKHTVSAAFFRLALESKAEPFRNVVLELKRYLRRHEDLSEGTEWKEVSYSYGLLKDEGNSEDKIEKEEAKGLLNLEVAEEYGIMY